MKVWVLITYTRFSYSVPRVGCAGVFTDKESAENAANRAETHQPDPENRSNTHCVVKEMELNEFSPKNI